MTEEFELHRFCTGIDCAWCLEPEPCIYKIANRLQTQLKEKEIECNKLYIQLKADEEYYKEENTLRKIIKNKEERNIELYKENNKLKQTLNDIKEIVEKVYNDCDDCYRDTDTNCDVDCIDCSLGAQANLAEQILRKIKDVLNEK